MGSLCSCEETREGKFKTMDLLKKSPIEKGGTGEVFYARTGVYYESNYYESQEHVLTPIKDRTSGALLPLPSGLASIAPKGWEATPYTLTHASSNGQQEPRNLKPLPAESLWDCSAARKCGDSRSTSQTSLLARPKEDVERGKELESVVFKQRLIEQRHLQSQRALEQHTTTYDHFHDSARVPLQDHLQKRVDRALSSVHSASFGGSVVADSYRGTQLGMSADMSDTPSAHIRQRVSAAAVAAAAAAVTDAAAFDMARCQAIQLHGAATATAATAAAAAGAARERKHAVCVAECKHGTLHTRLPIHMVVQ
mmetsp:Transcript_18148/g.26563  ORF Transcript_18148/g.26563 Transcript_18148/m.26563 type:complete len:310 (-) Transcript_18148:45-974(-)